MFRLTVVNNPCLRCVINIERGGASSRFGPINVPTPCPLTFCSTFNKAASSRQFLADGSFGSEVLVSALWRRELVELAFVGNAGHTGRIDVFNGTGMRVGAFNRLSLGMEHKETRQRLEISLVQRLAGVEWGIPNGSFWVSEGADSMEVNMQAYGLASLDQFPDTNGFMMSQLIPSYGVGISGSLPLTSELFPLQFLVDFQDVGVMWERGGGVIAAVDTGFATTGLAVPFSQYFSEGAVTEEGLTWQDVVDGTTGIAADSLYLLSDSAAGRVLMLPTKIQGNSPRVATRTQAAPARGYISLNLRLGWVDSHATRCVWRRLSNRWVGKRASRHVVGCASHQETHCVH